MRSMKPGIRNISVCGIVLTIVFTVGCVGLGPNTQEGALVGGAAGAVAGAIIGHNRDDGKTLEGAILGGALGAIAGGVWGNRIDHETGLIYDPEGREYSSRVYRRIPNPPRISMGVEHITSSPSGISIWISGYWEFDNGRYGWSKGHWEVPPPGRRAYIAAHWERAENGFRYRPCHWR